MKYNKRRGFFCKMVKRRRDSLLNRGKGRGLWAKCPVFFLPTRWETGEAAMGRRRRRFRRPGARGRLRGEGKRRAGPAGSIPGRSSGGGSSGRLGRDGVRQRAAAALGRRFRGVVAAMEVGKAPGDSVESITPLTLGRGDAQRRGDGRGRRRPLELGVAALQG